MRTARRTRGGLIAAALWLFAVVPGVRAATDLSTLWFAPDVTVELNGTDVTPQQIGLDDLAGNITRVSVGTIPPGTRITAYQRLTNGDQLLAFDTSLVLGPFTARPGDVVRFNGSTFSLFFDAAAEGVPDGAVTDAVALESGDLLLSFDITVTVDGFTAAPEDLVRFDGAGFSGFFDGSIHLVPGLQLDAADRLQANGHLLLSFDGSGTVGSPPVAFDDEDVLEYAFPTDAWELAYDGSAHYPGWPAGDLVALFAVPVPPTPAPTATSLPTTTAAATETHTAPAPPTATQTSPTGATATATQTSPTGATATATQTSPAGATATATTSQSPPEPTQTATRTPTSPPTATLTGSPPASATATAAFTCAGDCDGSGEVTVSELVTMVNIALGNTPVTLCEAGDVDRDGMITINEIIAAVANALGTCGS